MVIKIVIIFFLKGRFKIINIYENEIKKLLVELDSIICNSDNL